MRAEQITGPVTYHGEGAFWDDRHERLRLVDMLAGDVLTLLPSGTVSRRHLGDVAAVVRHRRDGGFVAALEHVFVLMDEDWVIERRIPVLADPWARLNEGGCDPQGRLYVGSMAYDAGEGSGTLFRLDPSGAVDVVLPEVTIPNGLVWSADGTRAFHADTGAGAISVYAADPRAGLLVEPRTLVSFGEDAGPDGMSIDEDDHLWVAMWGGGEVRRYTPDGELADVVEVPGAQKVTSCAFGGSDRRTLFITTSRDGADDEAEPAAGALFQVDAGVRGAPVPAFAG